MVTQAMSLLERFLGEYVSKCEDYGIPPKDRLVHQIQSAAQNGEPLEVLALNGNCVEMFEDRLSDMQLFPIVECLENAHENCYGIKAIDLSYNDVTDLGAAAIARMLRKNNVIEEINLTYNKIGTQGLKEIVKSLYNTNLNLSYFYAKSHDDESTLSSPSACKLQALILNGNQIEDEGGLAIADMLQRNNSLKRLELANTNLRTSAIIAIANTLRNNTTLVSLNLESPLLHSLREETTVHIGEMLRVNKTIKELNLANFGIRDEGIIKLSRCLRENDVLEVLDLSNNKITIAGAEELAKLLRNDKSNLPEEASLDTRLFYYSNKSILRELKLTGNRVDTEGAKCLASALKDNVTLFSLHLQNNSIGEGGLVALADAWEYFNDPNNCKVSSFTLRLLGNKFDTQASIEKFYYLCEQQERNKFTGYFAVDIDILPYKVENTYYVAKKN